MTRTRIKICGITRPEDAAAAVAAGADAIGVVMWEGSKRFIDMSRAREVRDAVPPLTAVVGVFVDARAEDVVLAIERIGITAAQLCGQVPNSDWKKLADRIRLVRGVAVRDGDIDREARADTFQDFLLDNAGQGGYGGTGHTFDWSAAEKIRTWGRIWLAGGLTAENVGDAIRQVRPHAVDVSSGVEISPGIKSPERIAAFVDAVHRADHAVAH